MSRLFSIANRILAHYEDAEESVNDTYLGAWNAMPPHRPAVLSTFLGKITRRLALKKHRINTAGKRGGTEADLSLDELAECVPANCTIDEQIDNRELVCVLESNLKYGIITVEHSANKRTGSEADCRKPKYIAPHSTAQRQPPEQRVALCAVCLCGCFPFRAMTHCARILKNEGADEHGGSYQPSRTKTMEGE